MAASRTAEYVALYRALETDERRRPPLFRDPYALEFDGGAQLVANVRRLGEPWTFGLHPGAVGAFVARSRLRLCEDLGADDYRRRYLGAAMPGYQFYRIAVAEVPSREPAEPAEPVG